MVNSDELKTDSCNEDLAQWPVQRDLLLEAPLKPAGILLSRLDMMAMGIIRRPHPRRNIFLMDELRCGNET